MFQIFQVTKINFDQYLKLHRHPDTSIIQCDATTQTEDTTIRPKPFSRILSNRSCTELKKLENLKSYWPSDECDTTDDELQKDPLKLLSTTILCKNHIHTFPFDENLQPIQSVNIPDDIIPQS